MEETRGKRSQQHKELCALKRRKQAQLCFLNEVTAVVSRMHTSAHEEEMRASLMMDYKLRSKRLIEQINEINTEIYKLDGLAQEEAEK